MARTPSARARQNGGMGTWIGSEPFGAPGSLYHDDGWCEAPMVPGTLACPTCAVDRSVSGGQDEWEPVRPPAPAPAPAPAPVPATGTPGAVRAGTGTERTNRYGGKCTSCGQWVEAEAGLLTKDGAGKWAAKHRSGACPAPKPATPAAAGVTEPGMYWDDDGDPVKVQRSRTSGKLYAKSVPEGEYLGGGRALVGLVRMTLDEAKAYGRRTGTCCVCSAELTDPNSIAAGIGPICASGF